MGSAREVVDQFYSLFAAGDFDEAEKLFDPACMTTMPGAGALNQTEHRAMGEAFKAAFPDAHMVIDIAVESGDDIAVHGQFQGTHDGDMVTPNGTIPASGNPLDLRFADFFKISDGRIVDHYVVFDQMEMLGQLGALPPAG